MNKKKLPDIDWGLLIPVFVLVVLSLTTLFSIHISYFRSQFMYVLFSLAAYLFFSHTNNKVLSLYAIPIYIISIILLALVLVMGIESRGAVRWFELFGVRIQFSEILKPFLAISLATFLSKNNRSFKTFTLTFILSLPVLFLIYRQPDLGSALVYFGVLILSLIVAGFPIFWFVAGLTLFLVSLPIFWHFLHDYQRQRILTFLNPASDPLGTSYNAIQSVIAVGSGMFFGKGFQEATQSGLRFLPERQTDFIFASITEGLGFVGSMFILIAFIFLLMRIYVIFSYQKDDFSKLFAVIAFFFILVSVFVNIGMNIELLPIVGITLPFVSYGGSSLLSNFILLGLLSSIAKDAKEERKTLEIR